MDDAATACSAVTGSEPECSCNDTTTRRRRHSFFLPRRESLVGKIIDSEEAILLRVDIFLAELERRLDFIEKYGELSLDCSISTAFSTLQAVRTRCSQASQDVIGAGRRRLHVLVETLDAGYHEALAAAESLNEKAHVGIELLEGMLSEFEMRAYRLRTQGLASAAADAAGALMGESRRVMDQGIGRARRAAESVEEHIQTAIARAKDRGLILYEDLPMPWRNNPHILRGYRFRESKLDCLRSMFGISNEFVNIWTHAVGLVLVLTLALVLYPNSLNFTLSTRADVVIAAIFFLMSAMTMLCSTAWHTMNAVADRSTISRFACLDYTGIAMLVTSSILTTEYTAFYCEPLSRWVYMAATAAFGTIGAVLPWNPKFNEPHMAWARVMFYVGLSLTGFLPMLQLYLTRGPDFVWSFYSPISKSLLVYLGGAIVYASKIPERWYPGMFDYFGGSHNLWHVAVLAGIFYHYTAMQAFFADAFRRAESGSCPHY